MGSPSGEANTIGAVGLVLFGIGEMYFWAVEASGYTPTEALREVWRRRKVKRAGAKRDTDHPQGARVVWAWPHRRAVHPHARVPVTPVQPSPDRPLRDQAGATGVDTSDVGAHERAPVISLDRYRTSGVQPVSDRPTTPTAR